MLKKVLLFFILISLFFATSVQASENKDTIFTAKVLEILEEQDVVFPDGASDTKQMLRLQGLDEEFAGEEIIFNGIDNLEVLNHQTYKVGDKVLVAASPGVGDEMYFYVTEYVRLTQLWWLVALFFLVLLLVGRGKGLRSFIGLGISFIVIVKYIIPQILQGANPLMVTVLGSFVILLVAIYLTEGFKPRSHLSIVTIFFTLIITVFLSWLFVSVTKLTGAAGEDMLFLFSLDGVTLNLQGLLLAGIIIGALGLLDDVVISQVVAVEEIAKSNPSLGKRELFKRAYNVGTSHISSMTNTLFLAYAGVSLPLLIMFVSGHSPLSNWQQIVNTELIASELVRTLVGSIGLILAVPLATFVAASWFSIKKLK